MVGAVEAGAGGAAEAVGGAVEIREVSSWPFRMREVIKKKQIRPWGFNREIRREESKRKENNSSKIRGW